MMANYSSFCCCLLAFFQNKLFQKILSGTLSECQTVWSKLFANKYFFLNGWPLNSKLFQLQFYSINDPYRMYPKWGNHFKNNVEKVMSIMSAKWHHRSPLWDACLNRSILFRPSIKKISYFRKSYKAYRIQYVTNVGLVTKQSDFVCMPTGNEMESMWRLFITFIISFGPRFGPTNRHTWSVSKLFDTLWVRVSERIVQNSLFWKK